MQYTIIAVSKIKEKYILEGIKEFKKRLSAYTKIVIKEVDAQKIKPSLTLDQIKDLEADKILNLIPEYSYIIALDEIGKQFTSVQLAEHIDNKILNAGESEVTMIIGGANGLSDKIRNKANLVLSMSKLTFPHQLARLFLIEQLYRAYKIINNEPYHK